MSFTIGSFTYATNAYTAQPFGYEELNTRQGVTARKVAIQALVTQEEWAEVLTVYDGWRGVRITEPDSVKANDVGTTVAVSIAANGVLWTDEECWFIQAPSGEQVGGYVQLSVELVVAAEALAAAQRNEEIGKEKYYFGTYSFSRPDPPGPDVVTTVNLLRPPETYQDVPQVISAVGGFSYIQGPLTATRLRVIEGDTTATGWDELVDWYEQIIGETPAAQEWYPTTAPSATAEAKIVEGLRVDTYTVSITLAQIK